MNFFQATCQSGPFNQTKFGLCDDQNSTPAYVDTTTQEKWVAIVDNPQQKEVTFTAIDKCVIQDGEAPNQGRCDCMLTTSDLLYLVELKDRKSAWQHHAIEQLESSIKLLLADNDVSPFRHKKAFACNRRHRAFVTIENEIQARFFNTYKFRIDVQATVLIV